jgi:hypothetical protein
MFSFASVSLAMGDESTKTTGTGTAQGGNGSMSTQQGGNTGPTTGRNADSGSATGKIRDPKQAEPDAYNSVSSQKKKPSSSHAEKHPMESDKTQDKPGH